MLSKLGKLSKSTQDQRIGKDAKKIARRTALVLNAVKRQAGTPESVGPNENLVGHCEDDFESIENSLIVSKRVDVNTGFRRTKHTKLARVVRRCDRIRCGEWEISLKTATYEHRNQDGTEVVESFSSLCLDPQTPRAGVPITVHFGETTLHSAVSFINPVISAYRTIPDESEIFRVVENDDLESLVTLLADGKATIRDCNELGTTLLHVGPRSRRDMCQS